VGILNVEALSSTLERRRGAGAAAVNLDDTIPE
jgi:hypothetical protein